MSRAGRKRLAAQRKSGIRVVAGPIEIVCSPNEVARSQPHRMKLYEDICHDVRAATPLGQLNLIGAIPDDLYGVATRFATTVRRWRDCYAPDVMPSIAGVGQPGGGTGVEIADALLRRAEYDSAMDRLATASVMARAITLHVVVDGGRVPARGFGRLMEGLRALSAAGHRV